LHPLPSQRHSIRVAAAPDWEFDFDKNPQNTQNPKVRLHTALECYSSHDATSARHCGICRCVYCQAGQLAPFCMIALRV
jgi:hypothetical protein